MQPDVGREEPRQLLVAAPDLVGELRHQQRRGVAGIARRRGREQHAVGEQRVELLAQLRLPLRVGLPAGERLETGRALERERLRKRRVDHQRRLVDLQRHGAALGARAAVLHAAQRGVQHPEQQLHQHRDVAGPDLAERAAHDQDLAALDQLVEVDPQRVVQQDPLDGRRVEHAGQLVGGRVELRRRRRPRVRELRRQLVREEGRELRVTRELDQALGDLRPERAAGLSHLEQARDVPQRCGRLACEHGDHRVAQIAIGAAAHLAVAEQSAQRRHDLIGDRVGRRVDRQRVEAGARRRHVQHRADPRGGHDAEHRRGRVALGVEHDHGAVLAPQIIPRAGHEQRCLALVHGADDRGVLAALLGGDRDRPVLVAQQAGALARAVDPGRRRRQRHRPAHARQGAELRRRQAPEAGQFRGAVETARRARHAQGVDPRDAPRHQPRRATAERAGDRARPDRVAGEHERERPQQRPDLLLGHRVKALDRAGGGAQNQPQRRRRTGGRHRSQDLLDPRSRLERRLVGARRRASAQGERDRRRDRRRAQRAQAHVRVAATQRGLHLVRERGRAEHGEPDQRRAAAAAVEMDLERQRPSRPEQRVQGGVGSGERLDAGAIVAVGLDQQAHRGAALTACAGERQRGDDCAGPDKPHRRSHARSLRSTPDPTGAPAGRRRQARAAAARARSRYARYSLRSGRRHAAIASGPQASRWRPSSCSARPRQKCA